MASSDEAANLPIYIGYAAVVAVPPIVSFTLPGVTAMPNVLPTSFLGTTTWAAPGLSIAISVLGILMAVFYLRYLINRPAERNWLYNRCIQRNMAPARNFGDIPTPPFWKAILPIILVIALTSFFQLAMHISAVNALIFGMWITAGVTAILHFDVVVHKLRFQEHFLRVQQKCFHSL